LFKLRDRLRAESAGPATKPVPVAVAAAVPLPAAPVQSSSAAGATPAPRRPAQQRHAESVKDLLDAGLLVAGEALHTTRRGQDHRAIVLPNGDIEFGGIVYHSLSTAAKAASGNTSEPGWEFWAVARDGKAVTLYNLRVRLQKERSGG